MSLPSAETELQQLLGDSYVDEHWHAALTAVMDAEGDTAKASVAVEKLTAAATHRTGLTIKIPAFCPSGPSLQLVATEEDLLDSIKTLKDRNHVFSTLMTTDEILAAREETEVGEQRYQFDDDSAIIAEVQHQIAVEQGNIIEVCSDDEELKDITPQVVPVPRSEIIQLCEKLELACILESDADTSLELVRHLRKFHGEMCRKELQNATQTTLTSYWKL
ncbi:hypothetical protein M404DRAFT_31984 [Pisolithus tinctorius Marx 270]|uniref:Uncharacterized protein n=1 Tax=Pisolithus tinctorius Marx 270 TaxID=870435 RepID=A0A0C3NR39_PISTI|nr:hypothetical protein M404DRAFT_31984 [Pisolithus tinctorius Marx 270]